jgi:hypothetical protein
MTGTTPRRRHSPAVYRRRRLLVLSATLVVAAVVVWLLVSQPWQGAASESPSPEVSKTPDAAALPVPSTQATPGATPTAAPTPAATPSPSAAASSSIEPCLARNVTVEAVTDSDSYAADQKPAFTIRLTNTGGADCTLNVGTTSQVYTVTSGNDTWWRSTDCQSEPSDMIVTLEAGQSVSSAAPLVWDRTRSAVATCGDDTRPRAPGGGASYHLAVEIGGIASTETAQFLLY